MRHDNTPKQLDRNPVENHMPPVIRTVLISIVVATCIGIANADQPKGWTLDSTRADQGVIEMTSPDRTTTAVIGPAAKPDGRSAAAYLDDFIARQYILASDLKRKKMETRVAGPVEFAFQSILFTDSDGKDQNRTIWTVIQADRPVQFVTIKGVANTDATRSAIVTIVGTANQPIVQTPAASSARDQPTRPSTSSPAALPKDSAIESIVHTFGRRSYNAQSGLFSFGGEANWVLFDDGWAYKIPGESLSDLDLPASRRDSSSRWRQIADLPSAVTSATPLPPQKRGARLALSVSRPDTSGRMGHTTTRTDRFVLDKSGSFQTSFYSLTSAAIGAPPAEGHGGAIENEGDAQGTYVIDGYTITLSFDSGKTLQTFFATDPSGNTVLGNTYYWK